MRSRRIAWIGRRRITRVRGIAIGCRRIAGIGCGRIARISVRRRGIARLADSVKERRGRGKEAHREEWVTYPATGSGGIAVSGHGRRVAVTRILLTGVSE